MILATVPFAPDLNLGRAYNEVMERLVQEDGWVCFLDHDMMFTTTRWYRQLEAAVATEPMGTFTAMTNRMCSLWQVASESVASCNDISHHRKIGEDRLKVDTLLDVTDTQGWGGVLMLVSKRAWRAAGGFVDGLLCVDHMFHYALRNAGERVYCIEGLYVFHWRGTTGGTTPPDPRIPHAFDARSGMGCPCRTVPPGNPRRRVPMRRPPVRNTR